MITAGVKLKLQIPSTTNGLPVRPSTSDRPRHRQPLSPPEQGHRLSLFPKSKLTLETVKRIWSSYSPINIGHHCYSNTPFNPENRTIDENVLRLRLGSISTPSTIIQSSNPVATVGVIRSSSLNLNLINVTAVMDREPEPGEILDDSKESGLLDMQNNSLVLDQARLILADSFLKTLKTQHPGSTLSREDVFQNYVAPINERQLDQLVTIGKGVFDDLIRSGKMDDTKRKISAILEGEEHQEDGRRVKRRSEGDGPSLAPTIDERLVSGVSVSTTPPTSSNILTSGIRMNEDHGLTSALSHPVVLTVNEGRCHASTIDATFDLPESVFNAADRWAKRLIKLHFTEPHIQIFFCSILKSTVESIYSDKPTDPFSSSLVEAFSNVDTSWPSNGGLFVSLNHEHSQNAGTWTPRNFTPKSPRLDITNYVVSGRNTMRLIQLQDYSSYIFFILAIPRRLNEAETRHCHRWGKSFGACQPDKIRKIQLGLPK